MAGAIGGPIIKDRWQFYTGYEYVNRDLGGEPGRIVTVSAANQAALIAAGVPGNGVSRRLFPPRRKLISFILRSDVQLNDANRLTGRYNYFKNILARQHRRRFDDFAAQY